MKRLLLGFGLSAVIIIGISILTFPSLPNSLNDLVSSSKVKVRLKSRNGEWINTPIVNKFAIGNTIDISSISPFLISALLISEDKRFFEHPGIDYKAIGSAFLSNLKNIKIIRGGSTISEQVARMILGGSKSISRRWQSALFSLFLETKYSKEEILSFYLSQLTFPENVRGIQDGSLTLFSRDLNTLTKKEILALICSIRAPSILNPFSFNGEKKLLLRTDLLINSLLKENVISNEEAQELYAQPLQFLKKKNEFNAPHFARAVFKEISSSNSIDSSKNMVTTTLDPSVQIFTDKIISRMLSLFSSKGAKDSASIIIEKTTGSVIAWVSKHEGSEIQIDSVLTPRQPGSTLKPFLYAAAFDKGWNPSTILHDIPTARAVGSGLKNFKNYSKNFYGDISAREALGNSLNIPAIETITFVGISNFYTLLKNLGITSLIETPDYYGEGLALGNGEISLYELAQAYTALSRGGKSTRISKIEESSKNIGQEQQVFSESSAQLVTEILSDSGSRSKEFGDDKENSYKIAYKTGTSTDFKDAWALGYSDDFVVGVWLGDLQRKSMQDVTGSKAPLIALRSIFTELGRKFRPAPVLIAKQHTNSAVDPSPMVRQFEANYPSIQYPTPGLTLAYDPRIPSELQRFTFKISDQTSNTQVRWFLNDKIIGEGNNFAWKIQRGVFALKAIVDSEETAVVRFYVK